MAWWGSVCPTTRTSASWASPAPHLLANRSWRGTTRLTQLTARRVDVTVRRNFMPFFSSLWFPVAAVPSVTWRRCLWSWEESLLSSSSATVTWTRLFAWWESDADRERVTSGHTGGLSGCFLHHVSAKAVSHWVHLFTDREFTSNRVLFIHGVLCRICRSLVAITAFKVSPLLHGSTVETERDRQRSSEFRKWMNRGSGGGENKAVD